jgi:hypothetical protein
MAVKIKKKVHGKIKATIASIGKHFAIKVKKVEKIKK